MLFGNMPRDGGHLCFTPDQKRLLANSSPHAGSYIRQYAGAADLIQGKIRHCLWINSREEEIKRATAIPEINKRLDLVRSNRVASSAKSTREFATLPHRFVQIQGAARQHAIATARVSSENREYFPVTLTSQEVILSDQAFAIYDSKLWPISILASRLHLTWIAAVCGRLKTDFRYSNTLGWNTFPLPAWTESDLLELARGSTNILLARESYWPATIADMYDPGRMDTEFSRLREAHDNNDEVLERIYIGRRFKNDTERLEKLFEMYAAATEKEALP